MTAGIDQAAWRRAWRQATAAAPSLWPDPRGLPAGSTINWSNGFLPATYQATAMQAEGKPVVNIDPGDKNPRIQRAKLDVLLQEDRQFLASRSVLRRKSKTVP